MDLNFCDKTRTNDDTIDFFYQCESYLNGVIFRIFEFHPKKLRFTAVYITGFTLDDPENSPFIEIGTCSRF